MLTRSTSLSLDSKTGQQRAPLGQNLLSGNEVHFACLNAGHAAMHLVKVGTFDVGRNGLGRTGDKAVGQISSRLRRKGQNL